MEQSKVRMGIDPEIKNREPNIPNMSIKIKHNIKQDINGER
jgi:hypothetical protein